MLHRAKLRTGLTLVAAATSLAVVATGPIAPSAMATKKKPGTAQTKAERCLADQKLVRQLNLDAKAAFDRGEDAVGASLRAEAARIELEDRADGCMWAQRVAPKTTTRPGSTSTTTTLSMR